MHILQTLYSFENKQLNFSIQNQGAISLGCLVIYAALCNYLTPLQFSFHRSISTHFSLKNAGQAKKAAWMGLALFF
jgi:hypothetical protein